MMAKPLPIAPAMEEATCQISNAVVTVKVDYPTQNVKNSQQNAMKRNAKKRIASEKTRSQMKSNQRTRNVRKAEDLHARATIAVAN